MVFQDTFSVSVGSPRSFAMDVVRRDISSLIARASQQEVGQQLVGIGPVEDNLQEAGTLAGIITTTTITINGEGRWES